MNEEDGVDEDVKRLLKEEQKASEGRKTLVQDMLDNLGVKSEIWEGEIDADARHDDPPWSTAETWVNVPHCDEYYHVFVAGPFPNPKEDDEEDEE